MLESIAQTVLRGQANAVTRNLDGVRTFKPENQIEEVNRLRAQLVNQRCVRYDFRLIDAQDFGDALTHRSGDLIVANVQDGVDGITNLLNLEVINHVRPTYESCSVPAEQREASVDDQRLPVNPPGILGAQERHDVGDVIGLAHPPRWRQSNRCVLHLVKRPELT